MLRDGVDYKVDERRPREIRLPPASPDELNVGSEIRVVNEAELNEALMALAANQDPEETARHINLISRLLIGRVFEHEYQGLDELVVQLLQLLKTGQASDSVTSETLSLLYVLVYASMTYVERLVQDRDVLAKVCSIAKDIRKPSDWAGYCFGIITAVLWKLKSKELCNFVMDLVTPSDIFARVMVRTLSEKGMINAAALFSVYCYFGFDSSDVLKQVLNVLPALLSLEEAGIVYLEKLYMAVYDLAGISEDVFRAIVEMHIFPDAMPYRQEMKPGVLSEWMRLLSSGVYEKSIRANQVPFDLVFQLVKSKNESLARNAVAVLANMCKVGEIEEFAPILNLPECQEALGYILERDNFNMLNSGIVILASMISIAGTQELAKISRLPCMDHFFDLLSLGECCESRFIAIGAIGTMLCSLVPSGDQYLLERARQAGLYESLSQITDFYCDPEARAVQSLLEMLKQ